MVFIYFVISKFCNFVNCVRFFFFFIAETDAAKNFLQKILDKDPSYGDAHILMAQVRCV